MKLAIEARTKDFSLTDKTVAKRLPVHRIFWLLTATFGGLLVWGLWDAIMHGVRWEGSPYDWIRLLRIPLGAVGVAGFLMYYIRWNDAWFRQHAEEEFRLKRLDLDIDRANWMVEMMLEWKEEKASTIPPELIDRLSRNLFAADAGDKGPVQHPAQDALAALLQVSTSMTLPITGGGSITVDKKGLRRLQKAPAKSDGDG
jgi:hypothetical protein